MRPLNHPEAIAAWEDAYACKALSREPVVIEVPLLSYLGAAFVIVVLFVGMLIVLPNPGGVA